MANFRNYFNDLKGRGYIKSYLNINGEEELLFKSRTIECDISIYKSKGKDGEYWYFSILNIFNKRENLEHFSKKAQTEYDNMSNLKNDLYEFVDNLTI